MAWHARHICAERRSDRGSWDPEGLCRAVAGGGCIYNLSPNLIPACVDNLSPNLIPPFSHKPTPIIVRAGGGVPSLLKYRLINAWTGRGRLKSRPVKLHQHDAPPREACDAASSHSPYILEHGGRDCCTLAKTKPTRDQAQDEHSRSGQQPQSALAAGWRWRYRRSCRGRGA